MSVSDLVHAALVLIDEHGGKLPGNKVSLLYQKNSQFKSIISDHGGPKKFCAKCQELEFVDASSRDDSSGWIQKRATVQTVLEALLELIDKKGGQVATSQLPPLYSAHKDIIEAHGGMKKICEMFPELEFVTSSVNSRDRYVRRSDIRPSRQIASASFVPDISEDLINFIELSADSVAADNLAGFAVLKVSEIRWSQDCIKTHFKDSKALVDVVQEMIDSPGLLKRIPSMEVLEVGNKWFAVNGNRRLWVLKEYARRVCPDLTLRVPVFTGSPSLFRYMLKKRFTTPNNGVHVDVVLEHRAKEYQRFQSMALALDHIAGKSKITPPSEVSECSASTATGSSSDEGDP